MGVVTIPIAYIYWHYTSAFVDILRVWRNFILFVLNFFSISLLLRTLFSPLHRMREEHRAGFDPADFFSALLVNSIVRIISAGMRLVIITVGLVCLMLLVLGGVLFLLLWILAPIVVVSSFMRGLSLIL